MKAKKQQQQWHIHMEIAKTWNSFNLAANLSLASPMSSFGKQMKLSQGPLLSRWPAASFIVSSLPI